MYFYGFLYKNENVHVGVCNLQFSARCDNIHNIHDLFIIQFYINSVFHTITNWENEALIKISTFEYLQSSDVYGKP